VEAVRSLPAGHINDGVKDGNNMGDNEIWCQAWRLLVKHKENTDAVIAEKIRQCEKTSDEAGASYWRSVAVALEDFR